MRPDAMRGVGVGLEQARRGAGPPGRTHPTRDSPPALRARGVGPPRPGGLRLGVRSWPAPLRLRSRRAHPVPVAPAAPRRLRSCGLPPCLRSLRNHAVPVVPAAPPRLRSVRAPAVPVVPAAPSRQRSLRASVTSAVLVGSRCACGPCGLLPCQRRLPAPLRLRALRASVASAVPAGPRCVCGPCCGLTPCLWSLRPAASAVPAGSRPASAGPRRACGARCPRSPPHPAAAEAPAPSGRAGGGDSGYRIMGGVRPGEEWASAVAQRRAG